VPELEAAMADDLAAGVEPPVAVTGGAVPRAPGEGTVDGLLGHSEGAAARPLRARLPGVVQLGQ
jgi:hypothetical protein